MPVSITLPDDLAGQLQRYQDDLPQIIALGLREWNARQEPGFTSLNGVLETLATLPGPDEVLALRPSAEAQARIDELLEKSKTAGLSPAEQREWEQFQFAEHLVRLAKTRAMLKLKGT
jgi:hypothetical protein